LKIPKPIDFIELLADNAFRVLKEYLLKRISNMRMNRSIINRVHGNEEIDDGYVEADSADLFAMVWDITKDVYVFVRGSNVERRLQRDVAKLIRPKS
jgi:hypothetical protein